MITIKQIPQRTLGAKKIEVSGSTLTLDDVDFDLSLLPEGATAENKPEDSQLLKVERTGDDYQVDVMVFFNPHDSDYNPNFAEADLSGEGVLFEYVAEVTE